MLNLIINIFYYTYVIISIIRQVIKIYELFLNIIKQYEYMKTQFCVNIDHYIENRTIINKPSYKIF